MDDQVRFDALPLGTLVGFALSVTVGAGVEAVTATLAEALAEPSAPVHVSVKVLLAAVSAPELAEPDVAFSPDHAPLAVQPVALLDDQVNVELLPLVTLVGFAVRLTVGAGVAAVAVTVTELLPEPPAPVHVNVKTLLAAVSAPVLAEPDVARSPDHAPLAIHAAASVEDHVNFELSPLATVRGSAVSVTVGAGAADVTATLAEPLAEPPGPVHSSPNVLLVSSAPVVVLPDVGLLPDHAPVAVQLVASVADQVSVELEPLVTTDGLALRETVGAGAEATTATVAELLAEPPGPLQLTVNVLLGAVSALLVSEPDVASAPDHAPEAMHSVASVLSHVSVELEPLVTTDGLALRVTAGAGVAALSTVTVADRSAAPASPEHDSAYVRVSDSGPTVSLPEVDLSPDQPFEALHAVALALDQVIVALPPGASVTGLAEMLTLTGAVAGREAWASPLAPPQPWIAAAISKIADRPHPATEERIRQDPTHNALGPHYRYG